MIIIIITIIIIIIIIITRVPSCKLHESETLHAKSNQRRQRSHRNAVPGWNTRRNTIRESFVHLSLGQLPSILRENSKIIPGMPRCSCFALCLVSSLVSCLVSRLVSRLEPRLVFPRDLRNLLDLRKLRDLRDLWNLRNLRNPLGKST